MNTYDLADSLKFTSKELNSVVSRNKVYRANDIETTANANGMGIYKAWVKKRDNNNKNRTIVAYYVTTPNVVPQPPGGNSKWYDSIVSLIPLATANTRSSSTAASLVVWRYVLFVC